MNERIQELAKWAGYNGHYATEEFDVDEFARLIVRECIGRVRYCIQNDLDYIAEDIEQHFGVSE